MKTSDEMRLYLERLMGYGLSSPWSIGGTPQGAHAVFFYLRDIWAELMGRRADLSAAVEQHVESPEPDHSREFSNNPAVYTRVAEFWRAVDKQLGIEYPPF